jgi:hypothetical protein
VAICKSRKNMRATPYKKSCDNRWGLVLRIRMEETLANTNDRIDELPPEWYWLRNETGRANVVIADKQGFANLNP